MQYNSCPRYKIFVTRVDGETGKEENFITHWRAKWITLLKNIIFVAVTRHIKKNIEAPIDNLETCAHNDCVSCMR